MDHVGSLSSGMPMPDSRPSLRGMLSLSKTNASAISVQLSINEDEEEKIETEKRIKAKILMAHQINQGTQLVQENKINKKNAFEIIFPYEEYVEQMIKPLKASDTDFTEVATHMGTGVTIYTLRVDSTYDNVTKMSKDTKNDTKKKRDEETQERESGVEEEIVKKKKNKKKTSRLVDNLDSILRPKLSRPPNLEIQSSDSFLMKAKKVRFMVPFNPATYGIDLKLNERFNKKAIAPNPRILPQIADMEPSRYAITNRKLLIGHKNYSIEKGRSLNRAEMEHIWRKYEFLSSERSTKLPESRTFDPSAFAMTETLNSNENVSFGNSFDECRNFKGNDPPSAIEKMDMDDDNRRHADLDEVGQNVVMDADHRSDHDIGGNDKDALGCSDEPMSVNSGNSEESVAATMIRLMDKLNGVFLTDTSYFDPNLTQAFVKRRQNWRLLRRKNDRDKKPSTTVKKMKKTLISIEDGEIDEVLLTLEKRYIRPQKLDDTRSRFVRFLYCEGLQVMKRLRDFNRDVIVTDERRGQKEDDDVIRYQQSNLDTEYVVFCDDNSNSGDVTVIDNRRDIRVADDHESSGPRMMFTESHTTRAGNFQSFYEDHEVLAMEYIPKDESDNGHEAWNNMYRVKMQLKLILQTLKQKYSVINRPLTFRDVCRRYFKINRAKKSSACVPLMGMLQLCNDYNLKYERTSSSNFTIDPASISNIK